MRIFAYFLLVCLVSFWLTILWGAANLPTPNDEAPARTWSKRPVCITNGHPKFCKSK
jgi:hypothetical protein